MSDSAKFMSDLDKAYAKKIVARSEEIVRTIVLDFFKKVSANTEMVYKIYGSPVWSGRYYASHRIKIGGIDETTEPENPDGDENPYPGVPLSYARLKLAPYKLGQTIFVSNSVEYAVDLEKGKSWEKTPRGIYRVAVPLIEIKYRNITVIPKLGG